jgi:hypothetical protein
MPKITILTIFVAVIIAGVRIYPANARGGGAESMPATGFSDLPNHYGAKPCKRVGNVCKPVR